jgi:hypothetical protein
VSHLSSVSRGDSVALALAAVAASPKSPAYWLALPSAGETRAAAAVKTLACRSCCIHHSLVYIASSGAAPAPAASGSSMALPQEVRWLSELLSELGLRDAARPAGLDLVTGRASLLGPGRGRTERRAAVLMFVFAFKNFPTLITKSFCPSLLVHGVPGLGTKYGNLEL